jgi:hypothetical protein
MLFLSRGGMGGLMSVRGTLPWWLSGGATGAYGVYRARGAASYDASLIELSGGGAANLTVGSPPSWGTAEGWRQSAVKFNAQTYLNGGPFTVYWFGSIGDTTVTPYLIDNPIGWEGGLMIHGFSDSTGSVYAGANQQSTSRFGPYVLPGGILTNRVYCYVKLADNSQAFYVDGSQISGSPKAGTAYSVTSFSFWTGNAASCKAFSVYRAAHNAGTVLAMANAMLLL